MTKLNWWLQRQSRIPLLGMFLAKYYPLTETFPEQLLLRKSLIFLKTIIVIPSENIKKITRPMRTYHLLPHTTWEISSFYFLNLRLMLSRWFSSVLFPPLHIHIHFSSEHSFTILLTIFCYLPMLFLTVPIPKLHTLQIPQALSLKFSPHPVFWHRWFLLYYKTNMKIVI